MMSLLASIGPIILLIIMALLLRFPVQYVRKHNSFFMKKINWFIGGYLLLLLIAVIVFAFIPKEEAFGEKKEVEARVLKELKEFHDALSSGDLEQVSSNLVGKKNDFTYQQKSLSIQIYDDQWFGLSIVVEQKESADGVVEASVYKSNIYYQQVDITDLVPAFKVDLQDDTLMIYAPDYNELKLEKVMNSFPIRQFTGERMMSESMDLSGDMVLYVRIPKGTVLWNDTLFDLTYVVK